MSRKDALALTIHAAAAWFMTGLIWFAQVVHYPLFVLVGPEGFAAYERANVARTACLVVPVMALEALAALYLLARRPARVGFSQAALGASILAVIWVSTLFVQFPQHRALEQGFIPGLAARLTAINWIRTLGWSARAILSARMLLAERGS
jgi:hypothetical protein